MNEEQEKPVDKDSYYKMEIEELNQRIKPLLKDYNLIDEDHTELKDALSNVRKQCNDLETENSELAAKYSTMHHASVSLDAIIKLKKHGLSSITINF